MKKIFSVILAVFAGVTINAQDLTILHMNDTHSHIEPQRSGINEGLGGVVEQAAYIDSVRCVDGKGNVILLHAGDFSQGSSYFTELKGDIEIDVLNAMKFDAVCLGNHEFDNGMDELARRLNNLEVPVVCANYDFSETVLKDLVKPYVILEKSRRKVGVIGLITDLSTVVDAKIAAAIKFNDPVEVANRHAQELKDQGCELVICLTHLGYDGGRYTDKELAAVTRNVDIIVGGHSHTYIEEPAKVKNLDGKEVLVITDGKWGLNIGRLAVEFQKNRLTELYDSLRDKNIFKPGGEWFPYPSYTDRQGWETLIGDSMNHLIKAGEKYVDYVWQSVPATAYLAYERTGERGIMETPLKENRMAISALTLAELAEGKGRFIDQIINGVWHLSHTPSWVLSAHLPRQASKRSLPDPLEQIIDLGSGALGAQIAIAYHFFKEEFDKVDPVIARVAYDAVKKQILDPYLNPDEQRPNWWLGFDITFANTINNWTPWCNADVILSFLLMEKDPVILDKALAQSAKSVDKFLAYVKTDGACEEGPAYWGHAAGKLYDYLQIMCDASNGAFSIFNDPQIKAMGEYISRSFVQDGWVVNFADATAKLSYSPALLYNYGKAVGSNEMMDFAIYNLVNEKNQTFVNPKALVWTDGYRCLESMRYIPQMSAQVKTLNDRLAAGETYEALRKELRKYVPSFTWYPETEFCYMLNSDGWFVATKGGHNNESHNHNDIGTFTLYVNGTPMFVDAGVGTYTKKTFSKDRYTIWSMCSDWHNLPVINGVTQKNGAEYRSASVKALNGKSAKTFALDIVGAYTDESACQSWVRDYKLTSKVLTITDTYALKGRKGADVENFMVQGSVYLPGETTPAGYQVKKGEVVVGNADVYMSLAYPSNLTASVEVMNLDDKRFTNVWGDSLRRISFTSSADAPLKGKYVFQIKRIN